MRMKGLQSASAAGAAASRGGQLVTEQYRQELEKQFGFNEPLYRQYWTWLVDNRLGMTLPSYDYPNRTAFELIISRVPVSLTFGLTSLILTYLICIPLGILKALYHRSIFDSLSSLVVFSAYALPSFALGTMLKSFFERPEGDMILPVICYVAGSFAMLTLMMKNSLIDQISADYVRTVIAKGASRTRAIWLHAFRNALIPIATGLGSLFGFLFAGSIIIETIFEIPGMGRLSWDALVGRDYSVFLALLVMTSILQLLGNLLGDILYMIIDPRMDFSRR